MLLAMLLAMLLDPVLCILPAAVTLDIRLRTTEVGSFRLETEVEEGKEGEGREGEGIGEGREEGERW